MPVVPYISLQPPPVAVINDLTVVVRGRAVFQGSSALEELAFIKAKENENSGYFAPASVGDWCHY